MIDAQKEWPRILGFGTGDTITTSLVEKMYRKFAKKYHPDAGGSVEEMQQLNLARSLALKWIEFEQKRLELAQRMVGEVAAAQAELQQMNQAYLHQQAQMNQWWDSLLAQNRGMRTSEQPQQVAGGWKRMFGK